MSQEAQTDDDGTLDLKSDQEAKVKEKVQKGLTLGQILSQKLKGFFNGLGQYCRRLFTVPLVKDIIYFDCGDASIAKLLSMGNVYDKATQELIESVFEERKDKIRGKETNTWQHKTDLDKFKGWTQEEIVHLRNQFTQLDREHEGSVNFRALCKILDKIGNKRNKAEREAHFNAVDRDHSGLVNFEEFCTLVYNLENTEKDLSQEEMRDLYKNLNREATLIKNLTVIEQLQSGLF